MNGGSYYIAVFHQNGLQTWSANPVAFSATTSYDFTTSQSQAYTFGFHDAMKDLGGVYALWSGDIFQDEFVDLFDQITLDNDISIFAFGYYPTDLSGDGFVDLFDQIILDNNMPLFLGSSHP